MNRAIVATGTLWLLCSGCGDKTPSKPGVGSESATTTTPATPSPSPSPSPPSPPPPPPPDDPIGTSGPPPSGPASPPVGSPRFCPGNDGTKVPLADSTFRSELPAATARGELDARNELCGDTWCEGSFEWFFYDLRSGGGHSELTMRTYANHVSPKGADATAVVVHGDRYVGRVLGQRVVPSCTTPCKGFEKPPRWKPCLVLDLRCEIRLPWTGDGKNGWEDELIQCGIALERAVRQIHPEFAD